MTSYFDFLRAGHTVLVSNARLAEIIRSQFNRRMRFEGTSAWPSASVIPLAVWLAETYLHVDSNDRLMLSGEQERLIWQQLLAEQDIVPDGQLAHFADLAMQTNTACALWKLPLADINRQFVHAEKALFITVAKAFEQRCAELQMIHPYRWLCEMAQSNQAIAGFETRLLIGFHPLPPLLADCAASLWTLPQEIFDKHGDHQPSHQDTGSSPNAASVIDSTSIEVYETSEDEIESALRWLDEMQRKNPSAEVALVHPQPRQIAPAVLRAAQRLGSEISADNSFGPANLNVVPAASLATIPMIEAAISMIEPMRTWSWQRFNEVLMSPYLGNWASEQYARIKFDFWFQDSHRELDVSVAFVAQQLSRGAVSCPDLGARLEKLHALHDQQPREQSLHDWLSFFDQCLAIAGWPGDAALDAIEALHLRDWQQVIDSVATLEALESRCTQHRAIGHITSLLTRRPQRHVSQDDAIALLNIEEAVSCQPDVVWVIGLRDQAWPPPMNPNPMLPFNLQRDAGMPGADAKRDRDRNHQLIVELLNATSSPRASFVRLIDDIAQRPPAGFQCIEADTQSSEQCMSPDISFTNYVDRRGPAWPADAAMTHAIGAFADHAACPFRSFARYRLDSTAPVDPRIGLEPHQRGELTHNAIAAVWRDLGNHDRLLGLAMQELDELVCRAVEQTIERYRRHERQMAEFWSLESERLASLIKQWLEVERRREPFEVISIEQRFIANVGDVKFNVRIDRIDRLADGGTVIIDYKTGLVDAGSWAVPRIEQPQLPIYVISFDGFQRETPSSDNPPIENPWCEHEEVVGIAYAQLRHGECRFVALPKGILSERPDDDVWSSQLSQWREDLAEVSAGFLAGDARVDPKRGALTCRYCSQQLLCRVRFDEPVLSESESIE